MIQPNLQDIEWALTLIKNLCANGFKKGLYRHHTTSNIKTWSENHWRLLTEWGVGVYGGVTKVCIIDVRQNKWVIKVNLISKKNSFDYCAQESKNYKKAVAQGFGKYFAGIIKIGVVENIDVYLQERADINTNLINNNFYEFVNSLYYDGNGYEDDIIENGNHLNDEERVYSLFRNDIKVDNLIAFINKRHINDLHAHNWGINRSGNIVMIDYSGYYSET